jgi:transposase
MAEVVGNSKSRLCADCPYREWIEEVLSLRADLGSARALHEKLRDQLLAKEEEIAALKALVAKREHQMFGRKSEKQGSSSEVSGTRSRSKRKRGQQAGNAAPRRRQHANLPVEHEVAYVPEDERCCPDCGLPLEEFGPPEVTTRYEIKVVVRTVVTSKERLRCRCHCGRLPGIVTAPALGSLFPGSQLGTSIWVELLASRYLDGQPMGAVLRRLAGYGLDLPAGTIHGTTERLTTLFAPLYDALGAYNRQESQWHADETGMKVWLSLPEGTPSAQWWLWTFVAPHSTVFLLDPRRSHAVVLEHLGVEAVGTLVADRHSAYKTFVKMAISILLAFCWAHVRRDFLDTAREWPQLESWCLAWRDRIGELYHLNAQRLDAPPGSATFNRRQRALEHAVDAFFDLVRQEVAQPQVHPVQRKRLESLLRHETGLRVFVDQPAVAMDNNIAERTLRPIVLARQLFYGCQSEASALLLAQLSSILTTLKQQGVNPRQWLGEYLQACALCGGRPPPQAEAFLMRHLPVITARPATKIA